MATKKKPNELLPPDTPEQMQARAVAELDRMRMMSIQSLAMQRIRDSVMTMSRETGFRERPVEQFTQAPLYIPPGMQWSQQAGKVISEYQQWSNTLGRLVGTPEPTRPIMPWSIKKPAQSRMYKSAVQSAEDAAKILRGETVMRPSTDGMPEYKLTYEQAVSEVSRRPSARPWLSWLDRYSSWLQAQRSLPT